MSFENMRVRELLSADGERVENLFLSVFTRDPWNDDWSDRDQLHSYMSDISGNHNSLSLGLFEADVLVGISLGSVIHWFSGTEYYIREFCISTDLQHKGYGSFFFEKIQLCLGEKSIKAIILSTDKDTSAYQFYSKNGFSVLEQSVFLHKNIGDRE